MNFFVIQWASSARWRENTQTPRRSWTFWLAANLLVDTEILFSGRVYSYSACLSATHSWFHVLSEPFVPAALSLPLYHYLSRNMDGNCWEFDTSCRESSCWGSRPTPAARSYHIRVSPPSTEIDFLTIVDRQLAQQSPVQNWCISTWQDIFRYIQNRFHEPYRRHINYHR